MIRQLLKAMSGSVGIALVLLTPMARAAYVDDVLSDGPVAYWRLNEKSLNAPIVEATGKVGNGTFNDQGGLNFGIAGAIAGDANTSVEFGLPSNFVCGAGCGYGDVPVGGVLDLGTMDSNKPVSLEAWFKILPNVAEGLPVTSFPRLFHYNNFDGGQYAFGVVGDNNANIGTKRTVWAVMGDGSGTGSNIMAAEEDAIEPSDSEVWYHFVALLQGSDIRMYLNGAELTDLVPSDPTSWQDPQATIGARIQADGSIVQPFPGLIDELAIYDKLLTPARILAHYQSGIGQAGVTDINELQDAIKARSTNPRFDLNGDGAVNLNDQDFFIETVKKTYTGDANLNGEFNSDDFIQVFITGEYEDNNAADPTTIMNSRWEDGDWNADREFDSNDFVQAFISGGFEQGPRPAVVAVPEPLGLGAWAIVGIAAIVRRRR